MTGSQCDNSTLARNNVPSIITGTGSVPQSTTTVNFSQYSAALATALNALNSVNPLFTNNQILSRLNSASNELNAALATIGSAVTSAYSGIAPGTQLAAGLRNIGDAFQLNTAGKLTHFVLPDGTELTWPLSTNFGSALTTIVEAGNILTGVSYVPNQFGTALATNPATTGTISGYLRTHHLIGSQILTIIAPVIEGVNSVAPCEDSDIFPDESGCSNPESNEQYFGEDCYAFDNCPYA